MVSTLKLDNIELDVVYKDIKNVHLSVHPPTGRVRISAPSQTSPDVIRAFAVSKLAWIRRQQRELCGQERESPREFTDRESHYLWGKRYLLVVEEHEAPSSIVIDHQKLILKVRPCVGSEGRDAAMAGWYRKHVREAAPPIIEKWEPMLGVNLNGFFVRRMKTKWGSCTHSAGTIRLNTELAKKPKDCLEYIIVHELAHLIEPTHNQKFIGIMNMVMPQWKVRRDRLNALPVRHERWGY